MIIISLIFSYNYICILFIFFKSIIQEPIIILKIMREKKEKKILDTNMMKRNEIIILIYLYRIYFYSQFANNSNI